MTSKTFKSAAQTDVKSIWARRSQYDAGKVGTEPKKSIWGASNVKTAHKVARNDRKTDAYHQSSH